MLCRLARRRARERTGLLFTSLNVESIDPAKKREIRVFSSRPGRRVWVADPQTGTVSSTLKFSLSKNPSQFLQSPECAMEEGKLLDAFVELSLLLTDCFYFLQESSLEI